MWLTWLDCWKIPANLKSVIKLSKKLLLLPLCTKLMYLQNKSSQTWWLSKEKIAVDSVVTFECSGLLNLPSPVLAPFLLIPWPDQKRIKESRSHKLLSCTFMHVCFYYNVLMAIGQEVIY